MLQELSATELRVAKEMTKCVRRKDAAENLLMSIDSVKLHLKNIYLKLNIHSDTELLMVMVCDALGKKFSVKELRERGVSILLSLALLVMGCMNMTPDDMRRMPRRSGRRIEVVTDNGWDNGSDD